MPAGHPITAVNSLPRHVLLVIDAYIRVNYMYSDADTVRVCLLNWQRHITVDCLKRTCVFGRNMLMMSV